MQFDSLTKLVILLLIIIISMKIYIKLYSNSSEEFRGGGGRGGGGGGRGGGFSGRGGGDAFGSYGLIDRNYDNSDFVEDDNIDANAGIDTLTDAEKELQLN